MQTASDAGALAAVTSLNKVASGNISEAIKAAKSFTASNHFTDGSNNVTVTVSIPPGDPFGSGASYINNSGYARVQISQPVTLFFGKAIGIPTVTVSTNSVGGPSGASTSVAILSSSGSGAFSMVGSSTVKMIGGDLGINSNSTTALTMNGSGSLTSSNINIVGNYSNLGSGTITGKINTNAAAGSDPFANLTLPQPPFTPNFTNYSKSGSNSVTLSPGVYSGGIKIVGSGTVTFNPGMYILYGGGLSITGSGSINGTGVTFYNTGTASGATQYKGYSVTGSGSMTLSAPTSGTYQGMLFLQDPANSVAASITGSASSYLAGNIYLPKAVLNITGSGTMSQPVGITSVLQLKITGSGNLTFSTQYGGGTGASSGAALYE